LLIDHVFGRTRERRTRPISENSAGGSCESTRKAHARMNGGGDERCFWQIAHLLFIVFFLSFSLSHSICPSFLSSRFPRFAKNMHAHTHVQFFVSDLVVSSTPSSRNADGRVRWHAHAWVLRSNRVVLIIITIIIMLAYPFPNARHGRLGNAQRRQVRKKESVGVVGWLVGEVDRVCSRSGEGKTGLGIERGISCLWRSPKICTIELGFLGTERSTWMV
jgi:hypothetical protein